MVSCHTHAGTRLGEIVHGELAGRTAGVTPRRILIKPNWVMHEVDAAHPISALVTGAPLIEAVVRECLSLFPEAERIVVGDCPELRADWPRLCRQSGLATVIDTLASEHADRVEFRDLRRDVFRDVDGHLVADPDAPHGDPSGYCEVALGARSHLEPIAAQADRFSIHDHDVSLTRAGHRPGDHRYLVCQTLLDADLVVNLPKWKAHSKAGVTGALKNLVGINGDKSYLPHFRRGSPRSGGDEYSDEGRWLYWLQDWARELVRGTAAHRWTRPAWRAVRGANSLVRRVAGQDSLPSDFYVVGGSWWGNQTIWRMVYDLNLIVQCADKRGHLQPRPQRAYVCLVDGLVAGEGDGPLKPAPRDTDLLVCGDDPFAVDAVLAWCMGFAPVSVPLVAERRRYLGPDWGRFDLDRLPVGVDGEEVRLSEVRMDFGFAPPPGWVGHVERGRRASRPA